MLIQHEIADRQAHRLSQRLRWAKLPTSACIEDLDARTPRGIERGKLLQLTELCWIEQHLNLLITGPTRVGKSWFAAALPHHACRQDRSVRYLRIPRLTEELLRAGAQQKKSAFFKHLAKADLLVLDDFALAPMTDEIKHDVAGIRATGAAGAAATGAYAVGKVVVVEVEAVAPRRTDLLPAICNKLSWRTSCAAR